MNEPAPDTIVHVSMRECRVAAERLLYLLGAPGGAVRTMALEVLRAAARDPSALSQLLALVDSGSPVSWQFTESAADGEVVIDLHVMPWVLAIGQLRAVVARYSTRPDVARLRARNGSGPIYRDPLAIYAAGYGFDCVIDPAAATPVSFGRTGGADTRASGPPPGTDAALAKLTAEGIRMSREEWFALFRESSAALSVETVVSRRHAGATMVDEAGNIHGEIPDGFDISVYVDVDLTAHDQTKIGMPAHGDH
jgi:hypothetical protein